MGKSLKSFKFSSFDGGVNFNDLKTTISEKQLSNCYNMIPKNNKLVTRKGLSLENTFTLAEENGYDINPIGSSFYAKNSARFYCVSKKDGINYIGKILVVKSNATFSYVSLYNYSSNDFNEEVKSINCICFSGKKINSGGVFIVVSVIGISGIVLKKTIFEMNDSFNKLNRIYAENIYAPLVLVNGRGFDYEKSDIKTPTPYILEDFNMLSTAFRSCYTTDGVSTEYYLPIKNLSNEEYENIKISYTSPSGAVFTWKIDYNHLSSGAVTVGNETYGMSIDRTLGRLAVLGDDGMPKALPASKARYNNLEIVAHYKSSRADMLSKMTIAETFNSRVFFAGNEENGNVVCFSKKDNPLYIPQSNISYFGDKTDVITGIKAFNDRLVFFKPHQTGIASAVRYSDYDINMLMVGKTNGKNALESMDIKTINASIGCKYPETAVSIANRLVFLSTDFRIYAITSSSNYLQRFYRISDNIEPKITSLSLKEDAFAFEKDGKYMLFFDNECYLFDYNNSVFLSASSPQGLTRKSNNIAWYYLVYDFGVVKPFSAICIDNQVIILSKFYNNDTACSVSCHSLKGKYDYSLVGATIYKKNNINSGFTTCVSDFGADKYKKITGIEVVLGSETEEYSSPIDVYALNENVVKQICSIEMKDTNNDEIMWKQNLGLFGVRYFGLKLQREEPFEVKSLRVFYKD